jgi:hypothetical protein
MLLPDLRVVYRTPEPAYEEAFRYVAAQRQPGDVVLTMNTSAADLLLAELDHSTQLGFAIQEDAEQFLLDADTQPVDRWLGAPWIGTVADLSRVLNEHRRTWFVVDTIRLPVYYRGDWLAFLDSQMDLVWSHDDALVYLSRSDRAPLSSDPQVLLTARFGDVIALDGYSFASQGDTTQGSKAGPCVTGQRLCLGPGDTLRMTLFWQAIAPMDVDYTVFVHLRDAQGETRAQGDAQPFDGLYPTSQWQPGETVAQPVEVDLPPDLTAGPYSLYIGLYRLDTMARLALEADSSGENAVILDKSILIVSGEP